MDPDNTNSTALIDIDMGGPDASDETRIPPDEYPFKLVKVADQRSKAGNRMLVWDFVVASGQYSGFAARMYTVTEGNGAFKAKQVAKAIGGIVEKEDGGKKISFDPVEVKGRVVLGVVEDETQPEEYGGEVRSVLKRVKPHPNGYDFDPNAEDDPLA